MKFRCFTIQILIMNALKCFMLTYVNLLLLKLQYYILELSPFQKNRRYNKTNYIY